MEKQTSGFTEAHTVGYLSNFPAIYTYNTSATGIINNSTLKQLMEVDQGTPSTGYSSDEGIAGDLLMLNGVSGEDEPSGESSLDASQALGIASTEDEIISVYEVFVKEGLNEQQQLTKRKPGVSVISAHPAGILTKRQDECALDLDDIDIISVDGDAAENDEDEVDVAAKEVIEREELEALQSAANASEENMAATAVSNQSGERPSPVSTGAQLIDKDDPRSRLHYVKYLKRDGKTLKIWECGICSKEFRHQYTLMRHLPTHTDERNFKCDVCGKAFRQLSTLSQHKAIHSDARPYVCDFCKKTFNRVSTLISHRKTHSEHKPHKCHLCGKGFHQKGNLRNHVFTHTNERPYKCDICGKGFNQMSNLVCHKVKAHAHAEKMQYSCGICGKEFPRRFALRSHEEYKHGIKYRQTSSSQTTANELRTSKRKSVRVVQVPEDDPHGSFSDSRDKDMDMTEFMENIIIDKIETKAMEAALLQGQTPFALFKPAKGIPVLVKVTPSGDFNHLLTPATADDLKISENIDSNNAQLSEDGSKSIQIKVPVVATVTEKLESDGKICFLIEAPGPEQEQVYMLRNMRAKPSWHSPLSIFVHIFPFHLPLDNLLTPVDSVPEVLPCEDDLDYSPPESFPNQEQNIPASVESVTEQQQEPLLELAAMGDIQLFMRPTENGRYEPVESSEARYLIAQKSCDVKFYGAEEAEAIVNGELNYIPTGSSTTTAVEVLQNQQSPEIVVPDSNGIMVLDPNNDQKALTLGDLEILNTDLRQILFKCSEERFVSESEPSYLTQAKIDEILNTKPITTDAIANVDQNNYTAGRILNELPSYSTYPSEMQTIATSLLCNRHPHQTYPYPISAPQQPISYSKNNPGFTDEEIGAIFGEEYPSAIDYSVLTEINNRLRAPDFDDDSDGFFQSGVKVVAQRNPNSQMFENAMERQYERVTSPMKPPDVSSLDLTTQLDDLKFLNTYDQLLKSSMCESSLPPYNSLGTPLSSFIPDEIKKDIPFEVKYFPSEDFENKENNNKQMNFKSFDHLTPDGSFGQNGSAIVNALSSVENLLEREQDKLKMDAGNFLQACSPCGPADFLYFENRFTDRDVASSPSCSLERFPQEKEIATGSLPDLDC
ncbi:uncharacterized protein LOC131669461 [Phymastichus coffea]|uniref:uncharacterized protein LOC131669461 n=1 Tax=Phymastichus coffea TaxID=108790 RepID=UPI00273B3E52|nr:uncharacterized protein LOC131669461 [Phymastichus coffea]